MRMCPVCETELKPTQSRFCGASHRMKWLWANDKEFMAKTRQAACDALTEAWKDPDFRKSTSQAQKDGWATSPEAREKKSQEISDRWHRSPELQKNVKAALSKESRKRWADPKYQAWMSAMTKDRHSNTDLNEKVRAGVKKVWSDPLRRPELCAMAARRLQKQGQAKYEYLDRKGRLLRFRSGDAHERGVAHWLDEKELTWTYEHDVLLLSDGRSYLPDFWVEEWKTYIEVKGWKHGLDKVELAKEAGHSVIVIYKIDELAMLEIKR